MASISSPMQGDPRACLFSLLPQKIVNQNNVHNVLKGVCLITQVTRSAIEALIGRELAQFDALVGEEACHIRAVKIHELSMRLLKDPELQRALQVLNTQIDAAEHVAKALLEHPPHFKKGENTTIEGFLQIHGMDVRVDNDLLFAVLSRFLTLSKKDEKGKDRTYTDALQTISGLSGAILRDCIKSAQKYLADLSVKYVQECAPGSPAVRAEIDEAKRAQVPCFFAIEALLQRMCATNQPLLIRVKEMQGIAEPTGNTRSFFFHPHGDLFHPTSCMDPSTTAVVIEGNCFTRPGELSFEEKMSSLEQEDVGDIVLANAAQHAQYAGPLLSTRPLDLSTHEGAQEKLNRYTSLAHARGFSLQNPSLFCIEHIFADKVGRYV